MTEMPTDQAAQTATALQDHAPAGRTVGGGAIPTEAHRQPDMPAHAVAPLYEVPVRRPTVGSQLGDLSVVARVIYLGGNPNKTQYMPGTIEVWEAEDGSPRWRPMAGENATTYIFCRFDTQGRPIREKMTADGRIFEIVHNIDHLANFLELMGPEGVAEFEIMATPQAREKIEAYARLRRQRILQNTEEGPTLLATMGM